jgi:hypothetical protein
MLPVFTQSSTWAATPLTGTTYAENPFEKVLEKTLLLQVAIFSVYSFIKAVLSKENSILKLAKECYGI